MRDLVRRGCLAAGLLVFVGCASAPWSDTLPPEVYLVNVVPSGAGLFEQTLRLDLRIENPNNHDLEIDGISLELELNGQPFATARSPLDVALPRLGSSRVSIEGTSTMSDVIRQIRGLGTLSGASYAIHGRLFLDDLGITGIPFERRAELGP